MPVKINVLAENEKEQVHEYTIKLLAETGVIIGKENIHGLLLENCWIAPVSLH